MVCGCAMRIGYRRVDDNSVTDYTDILDDADGFCKLMLEKDYYYYR